MITTLVGPEADARKPRERFQSTNNDGPLTGACKDEQVRMVAEVLHIWGKRILSCYSAKSACDSQNL